MKDITVSCLFGSASAPEKLHSLRSSRDANFFPTGIVLCIISGDSDSLPNLIWTGVKFYCEFRWIFAIYFEQMFATYLFLCA
ncbi:MAG TPA: hypothetical protein DEF45_19075 [Rhodopirellula sp.]|nr:hypothetical protein [Rhodopirellula sp.]